MVEAMNKGVRAEKAAALERWADEVPLDALVEVDTSVLRHLGELAEQRATLDGELREAVLALVAPIVRGPRSAPCLECPSRPRSASTAEPPLPRETRRRRQVIRRNLATTADFGVGR
jgi:hypothetical protein